MPDDRIGTGRLPFSARPTFLTLSTLMKFSCLMKFSWIALTENVSVWEQKGQMDFFPVALPLPSTAPMRYTL
jgi:hypothetical protein